MNLIRSTVLLATMASMQACHDAAGTSSPPTYFRLDNINGRSLPTFVSPIPEVPTVLSAALTLDATGHATIVEHRRPVVGADVTVTSKYTYKINGSELQFDYSPPCPPNALCVAPPRGTITSSGVLLDMSGGSGFVIYEFRLIAPD